MHVSKGHTLVVKVTANYFFCFVIFELSYLWDQTFQSHSFLFGDATSNWFCEVKNIVFLLVYCVLPVSLFINVYTFFQF